MMFSTLALMAETTTVLIIVTSLLVITILTLTSFWIKSMSAVVCSTDINLNSVCVEKILSFCLNNKSALLCN